MKHHRFHRLPLTLIVTLLTQLVAIAGWASYLDARVASLELMRPDAAQLADRFARVEERLQNVRDDIAFIRRQLERK